MDLASSSEKSYHSSNLFLDYIERWGVLSFFKLHFGKASTFTLEGDENSGSDSFYCFLGGCGFDAVCGIQCLNNPFSQIQSSLHSLLENYWIIPIFHWTLVTIAP